MVDKGGLACDPGGLIFEAYQIDDLTEPDARTIFFDWAMGLRDGADLAADVGTLLEAYGTRAPDHAMTAVLREGLEKTAAAPKRRGGWRSRR